MGWTMGLENVLISRPRLVLGMGAPEQLLHYFSWWCYSRDASIGEQKVHEWTP